MMVSGHLLYLSISMWCYKALHPSRCSDQSLVFDYRAWVVFYSYCHVCYNVSGPKSPFRYSQAVSYRIVLSITRLPVMQGIIQCITFQSTIIYKRQWTLLSTSIM